MRLTFEEQHELREKMPLLWWIVVQSCKDLKNFKGKTGGTGLTKAAYIIAYDFIVDGQPMQLEGTNDVFTFRSVLEDFGIQDEDNFQEIRQLLINCVNKTKKEQWALVKKARAEIFWQPLEDLITQGGMNTCWEEL